LLVGAVAALLPLPYVNIIFDAAVVWLGIALMKQSALSTLSHRQTLSYLSASASRRLPS
jgi:hypothetical protein